MKIKKLIKKTQEYLDSEKRDLKKKKKYLKEVLRKLSKYEKKLRRRLEERPDPHDQERFRRKLALVHEQRKKGLRQLEEWQDAD